jgi:hypothetical protein
LGRPVARFARHWPRFRAQTSHTDVPEVRRPGRWHRVRIAASPGCVAPCGEPGDSGECSPCGARALYCECPKTSPWDYAKKFAYRARFWRAFRLRRFPAIVRKRQARQCCATCSAHACQGAAASSNYLRAKFPLLVRPRRCTSLIWTDTVPVTASATGDAKPHPALPQQLPMR